MVLLCKIFYTVFNDYSSLFLVFYSQPTTFTAWIKVRASILGPRCAREVAEFLPPVFITTNKTK